MSGQFSLLQLFERSVPVWLASFLCNHFPWAYSDGIASYTGRVFVQRRTLHGVLDE
jgi:hypothetical protein